MGGSRRVEVDGTVSHTNNTLAVIFINTHINNRPTFDIYNNIYDHNMTRILSIIILLKPYLHDISIKF